MRTHVATDDGSARLGEVALVDGHSAVGNTGLVFYDTLFDENASSHIALGASIVQAVAVGRRAVGRGAARTRRQPLVDPHRLHDRLATSSRSTASPPTAKPCRSCATATGSCSSSSRDGRIRTDGFRLPKAAL